MSFRLFIYYSTAWGAAAAFCGWSVGRMIASNVSMKGATVEGIALGFFLVLALTLAEEPVTGCRSGFLRYALRLAFALPIGALGGGVGEAAELALNQATGARWPGLSVLGWSLTGLLVGVAPQLLDLVSAGLHRQAPRGAWRKVRNGSAGGLLGGCLGGFAFLGLQDWWTSAMLPAGPQTLWSPGASGFAALGACIGLWVALAQVFFREASLRIESGGQRGRQVLLSRSQTRIGRADSCEVRLFGDDGIEMVHGEIRREGDRWILSDMGTPTGIFLNGQPLRQPTFLLPGDRLQVGNSTLSFSSRVRATTAEPAVVV
jgi:hypothetical protein